MIQDFKSDQLLIAFCYYHCSNAKLITQHNLYSSEDFQLACPHVTAGDVSQCGGDWDWATSSSPTICITVNIPNKILTLRNQGQDFNRAGISVIFTSQANFALSFFSAIFNFFFSRRTMKLQIILVLFTRKLTDM